MPRTHLNLHAKRGSGRLIGPRTGFGAHMLQTFFFSCMAGRDGAKVVHRATRRQLNWLRKYAQ
jgi:hypothetical protein